MSPDGYAAPGDIAPEDRAAIEAVIYERNWLSDHGFPERVVDLYEEDCPITGVVNVVGREALRSLVAQDPSDMTQRHVTTNMRLVPLEDGAVLATTVTTVYRLHGDDKRRNPSPVIVDCTFVFRRDHEGRWKFSKRIEERVFPRG